MSIDLVPLLAVEWRESDEHNKLIGLVTITMKKNNSDQTKGKPWTESVNTNKRKEEKHEHETWLATLSKCERK